MSSLSLAQLIEHIADHLTGTDVTIQSLSLLLGPIREKYTGSGYYLNPSDVRLASVWIGIDQEHSALEIPAYVEVEFASSATLSMASLDSALGSHRDLPPAPNGPLFRIAYQYDRGSRLYTAVIVATLAAESSRPTVTVQKVSIRRDRR